MPTTQRIRIGCSRIGKPRGISILRTLLALVAISLVAASAHAEYFEYTGKLEFGGSPRFLPKGVTVSGSGTGVSSVSPNEIDLSVVNGFTGTLQTMFVLTAGWTQQAFLTTAGAGDFSKPSAPAGLHGKMAVGGIAKRLVSKNPYAAFPLTKGGMTGLGLGGTLPAISGKTPAVKFGTWTTRTVVVTNVIVASPSGKIGNLVAKGSDARTTMGMGTVQLVTPIRTVSGTPNDRGAIAKLSLTFAPEPSRGVLLLAGCAALALLGVSRDGPTKSSID